MTGSPGVRVTLNQATCVLPLCGGDAAAWDFWNSENDAH